MSDKMIIFDLDGTLWDSAAEVAKSWNIVLQSYKDKWLEADEAHKAFAEKIPFITETMMKSVMGKTMAEIEEAFMPDTASEIRRMVFHECEVFEVGYIMEKGAGLYDGVEETLKKLRGEGYRLAVVSNCQKDYVKAFMVSMNMSGYFCDYEEWGGTLLSKGENIRLVIERNAPVEAAVYVGDTQKDCDAAVSAGIPFIWAEYGFGNVENPDAVIDSFGELPAAAKELIKNG